MNMTAMSDILSGVADERDRALDRVEELEARLAEAERLLSDVENDGEGIPFGFLDAAVRSRVQAFNAKRAPDSAEPRESA